MIIAILLVLAFQVLAFGIPAYISWEKGNHKTAVGWVLAMTKVPQVMLLSLFMPILAAILTSIGISIIGYIIIVKANEPQFTIGS